MAEITFGIGSQQNIVGSGLGFYGASFGSSVQIGAFQDRTFVTNSAGTAQGQAANNIKFTVPATGNTQTIGSGIPITKINSGNRSFHINFDHSTDVNVQNCQLRIYDRTNINFPASGVVTKVCELVNFAGKTSSAWTSDNGPDNTALQGNFYGSGDMFWWGSPWPDSGPVRAGQDFYDNSSGVRFHNFTQTEATAGNGNGDSRLGSVTGDTETVGGTGVVVPLYNSPGSGGHFVNSINTDVAAVQPKWLQYYDNSNRPDDCPNLGTKTTTNTFGGTGLAKRHTWFVGISASPLSIGSKTQYGLYVSLEYL
tara:strand:+ start:2997 stop:3926 length:930 start_codon:yes stop_codon:yes gene_type:complete